jgi:hypothetical protein
MPLTQVQPGMLGTPQPINFKNRIINGGMVLDQRNNGASITPTSGATYSVDRWTTVLTAASKFSIQQNAGSVTPPAGFRNYLGVTSLSAYSVAAGDAFGIRQSIEGFNTADFMLGTASAVTFTLSFWVRSSLTGTFGGSFNNTAPNRCYPFTYTISAANTWEYKTVTVAGDTSGTWATTTSTGLSVIFGLGAGSTYSTTANAWATGEYYSATGATSVVGTNGATFYITGVQIEQGVTATSFDFRSYGQELALAQRYYVNMNGATNNFQPLFFGTLYNTTNGTYIMNLPVPMRTVPVITSSGTIYAQNLNITISSLAGPYSQVGSLLEGDFTLASSSTSGNFVLARWNNIAGAARSFNISAEL